MNKCSILWINIGNRNMFYYIAFLFIDVYRIVKMTILSFQERRHQWMKNEWEFSKNEVITLAHVT